MTKYLLLILPVLLLFHPSANATPPHIPLCELRDNNRTTPIPTSNQLPLPAVIKQLTTGQGQQYQEEPNQTQQKPCIWIGIGDLGSMENANEPNAIVGGSCQLSVVSCQLSVVSGQWLAASGKAHGLRPMDPRYGTQHAGFEFARSVHCPGRRQWFS